MHPPWPPVADRLIVLLGSSGTLHAVAVALALHANASWRSRAGFVAAATVLSIAAPLGGLGLAGLLRFDVVTTVFVTLALASAFGAVAYWVLVRGLCAPFLSLGSLVLTIVACEVAMLITALAVRAVPTLRDLLAPVLWWLAFSMSLCIADRRRAPSSPGG